MISSFADFVTALRLASGLTVQALSERAGLHATALHKQLARGGWPPMATLGRLAEAAGVGVYVRIVGGTVEACIWGGDRSYPSPDDQVSSPQGHDHPASGPPSSGGDRA